MWDYLVVCGKTEIEKKKKVRRIAELRWKNVLGGKRVAQRWGKARERFGGLVYSPSLAAFFYCLASFFACFTVFFSHSCCLSSLSLLFCILPLWCPVSRCLFFPPFKWQILYSSLFNVHSVSFSLWPVWRHIAELGDARLKATQARQERGVRGRIVFSWEPLWLVCGQLTYAGQPFKLMCFFFSIHVWLLPWGVIRLCQQYDIQPCATFITSTGREVLLSLWLVQDEWTE